MMNSNAAIETLDWLINDQLAIDADWMIDIKGGIRWWAYKHA